MWTKPRVEINRFLSMHELSLAAARRIAQWARLCVKERGVFTWVLSGGGSPRGLYDLMGSPPFSKNMPWSRTHLFWGDERCVPSNHPGSNFAMAFQSMISKVPIPAAHIHRIPGECASPEETAKSYEEHLRRFFESGDEGKGQIPPRDSDRSLPTFDLILLGVGKDGHTASLFPSDRALEEEKRWVWAVSTPKGIPSVPRITLTLPVINRARCVLFLSSEAGKEEVIGLILEDPDAAASRYPAARVRPDGPLIWLIDGGGS